MLVVGCWAFDFLPIQSSEEPPRQTQVLVSHTTTVRVKCERPTLGLRLGEPRPTTEDLRNVAILSRPAFSEGELRCAIRLFLSPEAQARLQWLRDIEDRIAAKPFLLGWSDEEDELCSSTHATLLEATRAMKQLKGQCFVTAFIDDKRA